MLATLLELSTYGLLLYWTVHYFGLELNWDKRLLDSKVGESGAKEPLCPLSVGPGAVPDPGGLSLTPGRCP